jgi:hypothetical protein
VGTSELYDLTKRVLKRGKAVLQTISNVVPDIGSIIVKTGTRLVEETLANGTTLVNFTK